MCFGKIFKKILGLGLVLDLFVKPATLLTDNVAQQNLSMWHEKLLITVIINED